MPTVTYRLKGNVIRLQSDQVRLALGGFMYCATEWDVSRGQLEQLQRENPAVEFVAQAHEATVDRFQIGKCSD